MHILIVQKHYRNQLFMKSANVTAGMNSFYIWSIALNQKKKKKKKKKHVMYTMKINVSYSKGKCTNCVIYKRVNI